MSTTQLFVELLVIGFGALAWLVILAAAALGYDLSEAKEGFKSLAAILPVISFAYVLGIVVDRMADWIFDTFDNRQRAARFANPNDYFDARRALVVHAKELWTHLEYGRSRLRICRGDRRNGSSNSGI